MDQLCRICLTSNSPKQNLSDIQEGLKISTLAMIILPIKITDDDDVSLPHKICSSCFEILIKAFKLRETSLESDRFLHSNSSSILDIKTEKFDDDSHFVYDELPQDIPSPTDLQTYASNLEIKQIYQTNELCETLDVFSEDLYIDLFKKKGRMKNASKTWYYFGRLMNGNGEQVGSNDFHYCVLCLENKKIVKYRTTSATTSLANHLENVHGINKDGEFTSVPKREDFRQPKKRKIEGGAATICCECGKNFSCSTILKRHMRIHGEKTFACSRCPSKFAFKENLQRHERTHEQNHFSRYICDMCGSGFAEIKSLKSHLMKRHLNIQLEKNFHCRYENCSMKFERKFNLQKHMLTHSDYKPHGCNYCDASYASKGDLYKHLQKLHVGDALWNCEYCQASFRLKAELQKHYNVHFRGDVNQTNHN